MQIGAMWALALMHGDQRGVAAGARGRRVPAVAGPGGAGARVMEPHIHANPEFRDLDDDDHVRAGVVGEWHLAYRLGPLWEDTAAYPAYLPLSVSFSKPTVGARWMDESADQRRFVTI